MVFDVDFCLYHLVDFRVGFYPFDEVVFLFVSLDFLFDVFLVELVFAVGAVFFCEAVHRLAVFASYGFGVVLVVLGFVYEASFGELYVKGVVLF